MNIDDVKKRFVEEVKLRAYDDKYIDRKEEREILQIAIESGITVDSARAALAQVCEAQDYVLETKVLAQLKDILDTSASNDGKVDKKEFDDAVLNCKKWTKGKKNDNACKRMVADIVVENNYKTSHGVFGMGNWFNQLKKELGM